MIKIRGFQNPQPLIEKYLNIFQFKPLHSTWGNTPQYSMQNNLKNNKLNEGTASPIIPLNWSMIFDFRSGDGGSVPDWIPGTFDECISKQNFYFILNKIFWW